MAIAEHQGLPAAWAEAVQRHAPARAPTFLADASRYLAANSPDRVPAGREAETLKNILFADFDEPAQREAVLYDLALASLRPREVRTTPGAAALAALGGLIAAGVVLTRRGK